MDEGEKELFCSAAAAKMQWPRNSMEAAALVWVDKCGRYCQGVEEEKRETDPPPTFAKVTEHNINP